MSKEDIRDQIECLFEIMVDKNEGEIIVKFIRYTVHSLFDKFKDFCYGIVFPTSVLRCPMIDPVTFHPVFGFKLSSKENKVVFFTSLLNKIHSGDLPEEILDHIIINWGITPEYIKNIFRSMREILDAPEDERTSLIVKTRLEI